MLQLQQFAGWVEPSGNESGIPLNQPVGFVVMRISARKNPTGLGKTVGQYSNPISELVVLSNDFFYLQHHKTEARSSVTLLRRIEQ